MIWSVIDEAANIDMRCLSEVTAIDQQNGTITVGTPSSPNVTRQVMRESGLNGWQTEPRVVSGIADWIPAFNTPLLFNTIDQDSPRRGSFRLALPPKVWRKLWFQMWDNVGVAHTASIEMKEVIYDAQSGTITNKAAICPWISK